MTVTTDHTHDLDARSWVLGSENHPDFPIQNLPFAIFSSGGSKKRAGVAIGDMDGDGLPDLVFANSEAPNMVMLARRQK